MFRLLMLAFFLAVGAAEQEDLRAEESVLPIKVYNLGEVHNSDHHDHHHKQRAHEVYLQGVHDNMGHSKVDRIVSELYNPDYIEPITVLDYRYLKTGGRDYTRGAGGQILILPKNVRINQKKEFENYDEMLEFLRIKQIAEMEAHEKEMSRLGYDHRHQGQYEQRHHGQHEHRIEINGQYPYNNDRSYQQRPGLYGGYKRDAVEPSSQKDTAV